MSRRGLVLVSLLLAVVAAVAVAASIGRQRERSVVRVRVVSAPPVRESAPEVDVLVTARPWPRPIRWVGIGGGATPDSNPISLEDDLLLARDVLGDGGVVLFAGGPGTRAVQIDDGADEGDPLRSALAQLFAPRRLPGARYAPTRLEPHGPATIDTVGSVLERALAEQGAPLLVWIGAHGDRGEAPADSTVLLWAGGELDATSFAELAHEAARPLRLVVASCFSGGLAELAFAALDPDNGPTDLEVCGLFATSWDAEASGCDPSPDRAAQEGYAIHFFEALRGQDREGRDARGEIDLDGDGVITLLEAHARVRTAALSFDRPTTMSSRLLRALAPRAGGHAAVDLPEEEIVVRVLGERLRIEGVRDAEARLEAIARRREELEAAIDEERTRADDLWWAIQGEMLARWPVLDDPWHADWAPTLERERAAIVEVLDTLPELAAWRAAEDDADAMDVTLAALQIEEAPLRRWLEARETLELASRLAAQGGPALARWRRMRACEASAP